MDERWLPIPGYPGYEVSDRGGARSLDRVVDNGQGSSYWRQGRLLKPSEEAKRGKAYRYLEINGRHLKVAVLMLEAFVGPKPFLKAVSRHLNDDSLDDRIENLAWGTKQEDADDRVRNGRQAKGERNGAVKLTDADVLAIRAAYAAGGVLQRELGEQYGVSRAAISDIITRRNWGYLTAEEG